VNTPTFTWAYTRTFEERGKKEIRNSTLVVFPVQWDFFHLIKNRNWVTKIIDRNNKSGKVAGNEALGKA
jgi:hypothetical protein